MRLFHSCVVFVYVLCTFLEEATSAPDNQKQITHFQKNFRRKPSSDSFGPKRVQILEAGSRPSPPTEKTIPKLVVGSPEIIRFDEYGNPSTGAGAATASSSAEDSADAEDDADADPEEESKDEGNLQGQDTFLSPKVIQGVKKLFKSKIKPVYGSPKPYRPLFPLVGPPSTLFPRPPPTPDQTDFGTFPPFPDPGVGPPSPPDGNFGTVVPVIGGGVFPPAPPTVFRSAFGARKLPVVGSVPKRRIVGSRESLRLRQLKDNEEDSSVITDYMFSDIKCYRTKQKEYFGAKVHLKNGFYLPYIRDRPQDPLSSSSCLMERTDDSPNSYHMKIADLRACGVEQCGDQEMCLTMVFPKHPLLALAEDEVTTIKCTPQKNIMSETRTISFSGDSAESRRSSSTVEGGGQEFAAEVGVFRQNSGVKNGLFVRRINSGGVVQLGEPLQLRSVVRGGDGWTFSKLSDVKVWRMRDDSFSNSDVDTLNPNDASEVIPLVDSNGCRNAEFKVISESHPLRDPRNDLVHHFNFKAFLFRGQRASEPLIVTAKVQACQDRDDCDIVDCSDGSRFKRSPVEIKNSSSIIHDWNSQMAFRVDGTKYNPLSNADEDGYDDDGGLTDGRSFSTYSCNEKMTGMAILSSFISFLLCTLIFTVITVCHRNRFKRQQRATRDLQSSNYHINPNSILKRTQSDFIRRPDAIGSRQINSSSNRLNKPLPSLPTSTTTPAAMERSRSCEKLSNSNVSKLLRQVSVQNLASEPVEYECISMDGTDSLKSDDDPSSRKSGDSKSDGVYIVYCCNRDREKRSKSAPASLREKKKKSYQQNNFVKFDADTEDSDSLDASATATDESDSNENLNLNIRTHGGERRTVRSVKLRNFQQGRHGHGSRGLRSKLNAIYGSRCDRDHGSFPTRLNGKSNSILIGGTQSCRQRGGGGRRRGLISDDLSTQLSSEDSAYSGSVSSKMTAVSSSGAGHPNHGEVISVQQQQQQRQTSKNYLCEANSSTNPHPMANKSIVNFVTRNDNATQIIVIPETNV